MANNNVIKKIKIKQADGTFSDYYPIGANAVNITMTDGESVETKINKQPYYYASVAAMKTDDALAIGDMAITLGYYEPNDGGGAEYRIVSGNHTDDGGSYHELDNDLWAELVVKNGEVCYNQFGAHGDGQTEDRNYLNNTHIFANEHGYKVLGYPESIYYVGRQFNSRIVVRTSCDWRGAHFIIDDRTVATSSRGVWLFAILGSDLLDLPAGDFPSTLVKKQKYISSLSGYNNIYITFKDSNHKLYREGINSSDTSYVQETVRVHQGYVLDNLNFDYPNGITAATYRVCDTEADNPIEIKNGIFTTYANTEDSYSYWARGIYVRRNNTKISNIVYKIEKEDDTLVSAPYRGFISIDNCVNTVIENCKLSAHKMYKDTATTAWKGSYALNFSHACDVTCRDIIQLNSINDTTKWGVHTCNNCHNLYFYNCVLNRIDCHRYLDTWEIKNCEIGHQSLKTGYGFGVMNIENTHVSSSRNFLELRGDYGSSFDGTINIKNCSLTVKNSDTTVQYYRIIATGNNGDFNYGYKCYFPILNIDGFMFDVENLSSITDQTAWCEINQGNGQGISNFTLEYEDYASSSRYPYIHKGEWNLKNMKVKPGKEDNLSYVLVDTENEPSILYMEKKGHSMPRSDYNPNYAGWAAHNPNFILNIENCHFGNKQKLDRTYSANKNSLINNIWTSYASDNMNNTHRAIMHINIKQCEDLQLGTMGDAITYYVEDSGIYSVRAGVTLNNSQYLRCGFAFNKCRFHFSRWTPTAPVVAEPKILIMNSVFLFSELPSGYTWKDLMTVEGGPLGTNWIAGLFDETVARTDGSLIDNLYELPAEFWDHSENSRIKQLEEAFGVKRNEVLNHAEPRLYFKIKGMDNEKPTGNTLNPLPEHHIYHAIDVDKWYYWDSINSQWVLFIDNSQS